MSASGSSNARPVVPAGSPFTTLAPAPTGLVASVVRSTDPTTPLPVTPAASGSGSGLGRDLYVAGGDIGIGRSVLDEVRMVGSLPYAKANGVLGKWVISSIPFGPGANSDVIDTTSNRFWRGSALTTNAISAATMPLNFAVAGTNIKEGMTEAGGPRGAVTTKTGRRGMASSISPAIVVGTMGIAGYQAYRTRHAPGIVKRTMIRDTPPDTAAVTAMLADPTVTSDAWALRAAHLVAITKRSQADTAIKGIISTARLEAAHPAVTGAAANTARAARVVVHRAQQARPATKAANAQAEDPPMSDADVEHVARLRKDRAALDAAATLIEQHVTSTFAPAAGTSDAQQAAKTVVKLGSKLAKQRPDAAMVDGMTATGFRHEAWNVLRETQTSPLRQSMKVGMISAVALPLAILNESGYMDFLNTGADHRSVAQSITHGNHDVGHEFLSLTGYASAGHVVAGAATVLYRGPALTAANAATGAAAGFGVSKALANRGHSLLIGALAGAATDAALAVTENALGLGSGHASAGPGGTAPAK